MTLVLLAGLSAGVLQDPQGNVLPGRAVNVYARGTSTPVQVYADSVGASPLTQPLTSDGSGQVPGYVASGVSIDLVDATSSVRTQAEPVVASSATHFLTDWAPSVVAGDWVPAVQAAHDWMATHGGGTLTVPPGTYPLTQQTLAGGGINFQVAWYGDNCHLVMQPGAQFVMNSATVNLRIFYLGGSSKPNGPANWLDFTYSAPVGSAHPGATVYAISNVAEGDSIIQLTNAGDETHFAVGDACYIKTGEVNAAGSGGSPDAEVNEIFSVDTVNHRVTLRYPAAKAYVQEFWATVPPGITSPANGGQAAPFGICNVQDRTTRNISFTGMNAVSDARGTSSALFAGGQILGLRIMDSPNVVMGAQGASMGNTRRFVVAHNRLIITGTGGETWGIANTGSGDGNCYDNDIISQNPAAIGSTSLKEGSFDIKWHHNRHRIPKSTTDNKNIIAATSRSYRADISYNTFENGTTTAFINLDVGGALASNGKITNNRFCGTAATVNAISGAVVGGIHRWLIRDNDLSGFINTYEGLTYPSATSMTFLPFAEYVVISLTAAIQTITAQPAGQRITLKFNGAASVVTTGNVKLLATFTGATNAALTLICDGTNWFQG